MANKKTVETPETYGRRPRGHEDGAVQDAHAIGWPARLAAMAILIAAVTNAALGVAAVAGFVVTWLGFTLRAHALARAAAGAQAQAAPVAVRRTRPFFARRALFGRRRRPVEIEALDRSLAAELVE